MRILARAITHMRMGVTAVVVILSGPVMVPQRRHRRVGDHVLVVHNTMQSRTGEGTVRTSEMGVHRAWSLGQR